MIVSIEQLRAARGLLGWSQTTLAENADLSLPTVKRAEREQSAQPVSDDVFEKLRKALEKAGVEFIPENGGGAGVRMAKRAKRK